MKSTGIVRKVDTLGRIVIPKELRRIYDIKEKDAVEIYTDGDRIIIQKYIPTLLTPTEQALHLLQSQNFHDKRIDNKITELAVLINGDSHEK